MPSIVSPLQLTVYGSLIQNQGLKPIPLALALAIATFNDTTVMQNFFAAVNSYKTQSFATQTTLTSLLRIGATVCPALGNSIPEDPVGTYPYLSEEYLINYLSPVDGSTIDPSGFSNLIEQTCAAYLGNGDASKFCQGFMAVQGYISTTNEYINSAVNANRYLGPTFTNMDDLVTGGIASASTDLANYGVDLARQGDLWNMSKLDLYGTPAGLIQQISAVAGIRSRTTPELQTALTSTGLSTADIASLVNDNRVRLNNPDGLTDNEFDKLQMLAYNAMTMIDGDALTQILDILNVTTPNIDSLDDLLNPVKMFPLSYASLQTPGPDGPVPIFNSVGAVNSNVKPVVNNYLPGATGCDELGKIIPQAWATANKAIQLAFQQINNVVNTTLPELANVIVGNTAVPVSANPALSITVSPWNIAQSYLPNAVVSTTVPGSQVPLYYRAKSPGCTLPTFTVPPGVDINNTDYWTPTTLGGINTMADLPLIQDQTTPVNPAILDYIADNIATGTGPCGTITVYDVIGLAIDSSDFASQLNTATAAINALQTAGSLAALNTAYNGIASASNNIQVVNHIADANAAISALSASPYVTTLNGAWTYMANLMNLSAKYTTQAGFDYFNSVASTTSIGGFVQNLPYYGLLTAAGDAAQFLGNLADTTVIGGQAIIGSMREGQNNTRMSSARLNRTNQIPSNQIVAPIPVIGPVN